MCQVCLLDLEYNLPVQVRDSATGEDTDQLPQSDVGKEYQLQRMADEGELGTTFNGPQANDTILKLQRTTPYYKVGGRGCMGISNGRMQRHHASSSSSFERHCAAYKGQMSSFTELA